MASSFCRVALADGVHVRVRMTLVDGDEFRSESQADDGDVDLVRTHNGLSLIGVARSPVSHTSFNLQSPRKALACSMALAASSLTKRSACGSHSSLRARLTAISASWQSVSDRTAVSMSQIARRAGLDRIDEIAGMVAADRQLDRHRAALVLRIAQECSDRGPSKPRA